MLRSSPTMLLAAALTLGLGASAFAEPVHHHARHARHHAARGVAVPAAAAAVGVGVLPVVGDDAYLYGPGYRNGADEDLTTDSVGVGREEAVPGPATSTRASPTTTPTARAAMRSKRRRSARRCPICRSSRPSSSTSRRRGAGA